METSEPASWLSTISIVGRSTGGSLLDLESHLACFNLDMYATSAGTQDSTDFRKAVKIANFGRHIWASKQGSNEVNVFFKFIYVNNVLYYIAVVSVKFGM